MGNCHPEKTNVDSGDSFRALNNYIILNVKETLRLVLKQSRSSEYLSMYFVPYAHKFCSVDIF